MSRIGHRRSLDLALAATLDGLRLKLSLDRFNSGGVRSRRARFEAAPEAGEVRTNLAYLPTRATQREAADRYVPPVANDTEPTPLDFAAPAPAHAPEAGPRRRRLQRLTRPLATAALALAVLLPTAGPPALAYATRDRIGAVYGDLQYRTTAIQIRDAAGLDVGLRAQPGLEPNQLVLRSSDVPEDFYRMLEWLEDRHAAPHRSWYGIDYGSIAKSLVCVSWRVISFGDANECGGASTLIMQAARGSHGWWGGRRADRFGRKLTEVLDAPALTVLYPRGSRERRVFVADSLTYGYTAGSGFELWGVRNASLVMFGLEPEQLSLAQQAVLAALPFRRLVLRCSAPSDEVRREDETIWEQIRGRADYALRNTFASSDPRGAAARAELRWMPRPSSPTLPQALARRLTPSSHCAAAANPFARAGAIASTELDALAPELSRVAAQNRTAIAEVKLTVDMIAQLPFKRDTRNILRSVELEQRSKLRRPLLDGDERADILLVGVGADGAIRQIYASARRGLLDQRRRTGSIGKLAVAMAAAGQGRDVAEDLCQRRDPGGVREANSFVGYPTCAGPALFPVTTVFGRSLNLPVLDLARRVGQSRVAESATAAGFILPDGIEPGRALVTGMGESTPRRLLAMSQALSNGAAGRPAVATLPYVLARVRVGDEWRVPDRARVVLPQGYFASERSRSFLAAAAGAALRHRRGTLRALVSTSPPVPGEIGKSGTVAGPRPALDTLAALAVGAAPGRFAWLSVAAAPSGVLGSRDLRLLKIPASLRERVRSRPADQGSQPFPAGDQSTAGR